MLTNKYMGANCCTATLNWQMSCHQNKVSRKSPIAADFGVYIHIYIHTYACIHIYIHVYIYMYLHND